MFHSVFSAILAICFVVIGWIENDSAIMMGGLVLLDIAILHEKVVTKK